jgi:dTDP-4-dehydrorhamnose reductase
MRVLVTGAGGQLGSELVAAAMRAGHEVVGKKHYECDIAVPGAAARSIEEVRPNAVINCAAWTRVDAAEADVEGAYRANAVGPRLLAYACHDTDVLLCHVSTDFVFDGTSVEPIHEWMPTKPLGVYGASKLAGEEEVRGICPYHQVVRTAWLYGQAGPNFVLTMLRLARERGALRVVSDQVGSPTWTGHLAPALLRLLELGIPGTYHLTNSGAASWHDLAVAAVDEVGMGGVPVEPITTLEYPTPAKRPAYSVLDNRAWRLLGERPLPQWRDGLRAYLRQM